MILVIGILAALVAPSFLSWARNKEVDEALVEVVGALTEARNEALRVNQSCTVEVDSVNRVVHATTSSAQNCLPTGRRDLKTISTAIEVRVDFNGLTQLTFSPKQTTTQSGLIVLSQSDASKRRCVVVSKGLGLIRAGFYTANSGPLDVSECRPNS